VSIKFYQDKNNYSLEKDEYIAVNIDFNNLYKFSLWKELSSQSKMSFAY